MSYFDPFLHSDSPRRIYDALPLSFLKRGGSPLADFGVSQKNTTINCAHSI